MAQASYDPAFLAAVQRLLADEGAYVDNSADAGGPTKFGICKRDYPELDIRNLTLDTAKAIYFKDFWLRPHFDLLADKLLAAKVFDLAVDMGSEEAVQLLQRALRAASQNIFAQLADDGKLGPATLKAVNAFSIASVECSHRLLAALRGAAGEFYVALAARDNRDAEFLKGWLNRAYE